jgi:hypothetical protein
MRSSDSGELKTRARCFRMKVIVIAPTRRCGSSLRVIAGATTICAQIANRFPGSEHLCFVWNDGLQQELECEDNRHEGQHDATSWRGLACNQYLCTSQKHDPQRKIGRPNNRKSATGDKLCKTCGTKHVMFVEGGVSAASDQSRNPGVNNARHWNIPLGEPKFSGS